MGIVRPKSKNWSSLPGISKNGALKLIDGLALNISAVESKVCKD
jgi:hypothetical protein